LKENKNGIHFKTTQSTWEACKRDVDADAFQNQFVNANLDEIENLRGIN